MATPDTRALGRDLVFLLALPAGLLVGVLSLWRPWEVSTYVPQAPQTVYSVAAGLWDWADADSFCVKNPHRIWFAPRQDSMYIYYARPWTDSAGTVDSGAVYELQGHSGSHLRGFIVDETRRTPAGELVVWDLVLTSPNSYAWHRSDWVAGSYTKPIRRCPQPPPPN